METLPAIAPEVDPAAVAFARLGEKVDLLEAAVTGLAAKRDAAPDYSETLGEITARLDRTRDAIRTLATRPAMQLTPITMAAEIETAGNAARAADGRTIAHARERIDAAAGWIERLAGTIATARDQRRRLAWAAGGGLLTGMLLWSFLPGVILRALPQRWHMPEAMAARIIGEPTLWEAGDRIMRAGDPQAWRALNRAAILLRDNRESIEQCRAVADRTKEAASWWMVVRPRLESDSRSVSRDRDQ